MFGVVSGSAEIFTFPLCQHGQYVNRVASLRRLAPLDLVQECKVMITS